MTLAKLEAGDYVVGGLRVGTPIRVVREPGGWTYYLRGERYGGYPWPTRRACLEHLATFFEREEEIS